MSTACFPNIIGSLVERTFNSLMSGGFLTHFSCLGSKRSHLCKFQRTRVMGSEQVFLPGGITDGT